MQRCLEKTQTETVLPANRKYLSGAGDIYMLITPAVAITLSQQNTSIIIIITLFNYVIIAAAEGNLSALLVKEGRLFFIKRSHTFLSMENIGGLVFFKGGT